MALGMRLCRNLRWRMSFPVLADRNSTLPRRRRALESYTLISNHTFVDGNKRIGMYVMLTFLEVNGIRLDCANDEVVEVGLAVASGAMDYETLLEWVRAHRV